MAENSKIAWTDHTFNPFIGCTKVSDGCKFCYAEHDTFARIERSHGRELWGPTAERHRTSEAYWKKPLLWNKTPWYECPDCGWRGLENKHVVGCPCCAASCNPTRQRVFCASLADVGDHHPSIKNEWIEDLVRLVETCINLDFLFLTKRVDYVRARFTMFWGLDEWPANIWVGASVENQNTADERIPELLKVPAKIKFVSVEPILGPVDLVRAVNKLDWLDPAANRPNGIDWVICGGESGPSARPMDIEWARSLRNQCRGSDVPFFMKQLGGHPDKRDVFSRFPDDLMIREWPHEE